MDILNGIPIKEMLLSADKYPIKAPYKMAPSRIVIHNTANDASAENEIKYMLSNSSEVSFHFAVDDREIIKAIQPNRNAWHAGDGQGKGNREGIAIEICYAKSGGERFIKAQQNAARLCAWLLAQYGWGIDRITKHADYSSKNCPHRTLEMGWDNFLNEVKSVLAPQNSPASVTYQGYDNTQRKWLPNVTDRTDFAGLFGHAIGGIYMNSSAGQMRYRAHLKGKGWLPEVADRTDYAGILNQPIDAVVIESDRPVLYQVHLKTRGVWLPAVSSKNADINDSVNGYAGIIGQEIDAIYIWGE